MNSISLVIMVHTFSWGNYNTQTPRMSDKSMSMLFTLMNLVLHFFCCIHTLLVLKIHTSSNIHTVCHRVRMFKGMLTYIVWVWQWWGCSIEWTVAWFLSHTNKSISHHLWLCSKGTWGLYFAILKGPAWHVQTPFSFNRLLSSWVEFGGNPTHVQSIIQNALD